METPTTEAFWWHDFVRHAGLGAADYQVVAFGDNLGIATELAALVVATFQPAFDCGRSGAAAVASSARARESTDPGAGLLTVFAGSEAGVIPASANCCFGRGGAGERARPSPPCVPWLWCRRIR
jgi:hypothetical protein